MGEWGHHYHIIRLDVKKGTFGENSRGILIDHCSRYPRSLTQGLCYLGKKNNINENAHMGISVDVFINTAPMSAIVSKLRYLVPKTSRGHGDWGFGCCMIDPLIHVMTKIINIHSPKKNWWILEWLHNVYIIIEKIFHSLHYFTWMTKKKKKKIRLHLLDDCDRDRWIFVLLMNGISVVALLTRLFKPVPPWKKLYIIWIFFWTKYIMNTIK